MLSSIHDFCKNSFIQTIDLLGYPTLIHYKLIIFMTHACGYLQIDEGGLALKPLTEFTFEHYLTKCRPCWIEITIFFPLGQIKN